MKKNELYYLLINARTAKEKLGLSYVNLAELIGVYFGTVERWFNHKQEPSELNIYKLNWFVFLVLDRNVSYESLKKNFNLADMTLYSTPMGKGGHVEPWNDIFGSDICINHCYSDNAKDELPFDLDDEDYEEFEFFDDEDDDLDLASVLTFDDDFFDDDLCLYDFLNDELKLHGSIQEGIKRIELLQEYCDSYLDLANMLITENEDGIKRAYAEVHDFETFVGFLRTLDCLSEDDERYNLKDGSIVMKISSYTNPVLKTVNTKIIDHIDAYLDCVVVTCKDSTVYELPADSSFAINSTSSLRSPDFNFICRIDNNYYAISFERK